MAEVAAHASLSLAGRARYLRKGWLEICEQIGSASRRRAGLGRIQDARQRRVAEVELDLAEYDNRQSFNTLRRLIDRHNSRARVISEDFVV